MNATKTGQTSADRQQPAQQRTLERLERACRSAIAAPGSVSGMAAAAGWSRGYFQRVFKQVLGISPGEFIRSRRLQQFSTLLQNGCSVTEAIHQAGFGSSSRAHQAIDEGMGMSARNYRAKGAGIRIQYGLGHCSLGRVLVASTERGLCAILLGDEPYELEQDLVRRFANARIEPAAPAFQSTLNQVVELLDQSHPDLGRLPVDLIGTVFQRRVWTALQRIPSGQTVSYAELAQRIGQPNSHRAVATACGANPLAVVVPCHRIVRSDGGLGGYRWGLARKQKLLAREKSD